jgi:hypothetical protein
MFQLEAAEVALKFPHFARISLHQQAHAGLAHLVDRQLGVTSNGDVSDAQ